MNAYDKLKLNVYESGLSLEDCDDVIYDIESAETEEELDAAMQHAFDIVETANIIKDSPMKKLKDRVASSAVGTRVSAAARNVESKHLAKKAEKLQRQNMTKDEYAQLQKSLAAAEKRKASGYAHDYSDEEIKKAKRRARMEEIKRSHGMPTKGVYADRRPQYGDDDFDDSKMDF